MSNYLYLKWVKERLITSEKTDNWQLMFIVKNASAANESGAGTNPEGNCANLFLHLFLLLL